MLPAEGCSCWSCAGRGADARDLEEGLHSREGTRRGRRGEKINGKSVEFNNNNYNNKN